MSHSGFSKPLFVLVGIAAVLVIRARVDSTHSDEPRPVASGAEQATGTPTPRAAGPAEWEVSEPLDSKPIAEFGAQPVFIADGYRQSVVYGPEEDDQGIVQENELTILTDEMAPDTGVWFNTSAAYSASFSIKRVQSRVANELYIVGKGRGDEDILEQWLIIPSQGSLTPTRPAATLPVGTPIPPSSVTVGVVGGGPFTPPGSRPAPPTVSRNELYRGFDFGGILDLALDPEGRFVLVLAEGDHGLYRIDLSPPAATLGVPTLVYDTTQIPNLAASRAIYPLQHVSYGRMYVLDPNFGAGVVPLVTSLFDYDNDGVFDAFQSLPVELHKQTYPGTSWIDNFYIY